MDLQDRLLESIKDGTGLDIVLAFIAPDTQMGLVPQPGSHVIDEDFAGNQNWVYNYEITIKSEDAQEAAQKLMIASNYLNSLSQLKSQDKSFLFQSIEVSSAPAELYADEIGVMYGLDVSVNVTQNKYMEV